MMEQMLKSKHAAMSHISHEIRTPLMLVTEPLKNISKKITDKQVLEDIDVINRNAQRVSTLVDQLLEIERLSGVRNVPLHKYDIKESCQFLVESIRPIVEQKEQTLRLRLKASGEIFLIQDTLQQVFYNLMSNAVKYSPSNSEITVTTKNDGDFLLISIEDQGPGLSASEIKEVFNRFSRLENSQKQDGMGLGLSLLKQLVKANKGHINIVASKSGGARFDVSLPLQLLQEDKHSLPTKVIEPKSSQDFSNLLEKKQQTQMPVMVIADDSKDFRDHLSKLFEGDYLCFVVKDGKEALKAVQVLQPDILLTDYAMPRMTGIELVRKVRENEALAGMTIFMLSALRDKKIVQQAHGLMLDDYIFKPFDQDLLKQKVNNRMKVKKDIKYQSTDENDSAIFLGLNPNLDGEKDHQFYINFRACLEKNVSKQDFSRERCAEDLFISGRQLNRKLQLVLGISFSDVLKKYRVELAKQKLAEGISVTDTAFDCGFSNPSYFSTIFKAETGVTPTDFAKNNAEVALS
jgi:CheY-like chemotaxis protein/two-component sensor histidine kinase